MYSRILSGQPNQGHQSSLEVSKFFIHCFVEQKFHVIMLVLEVHLAGISCCICREWVSTKGRLSRKPVAQVRLIHDDGLWSRWQVSLTDTLCATVWRQLVGYTTAWNEIVLFIYEQPQNANTISSYPSNGRCEAIFWPRGQMRYADPLAIFWQPRFLKSIIKFHLPFIFRWWGVLCY